MKTAEEHFMCGKHKKKIEVTICPFDEDVNGEKRVCLVCCEDCEQECSDNI